MDLKKAGDFLEKIVIVGDGPAGISAALYAARGNMEPLVVGMGSSSLDKAELIQNYYGLSKPMTGQELHETGIAQAKELGVRFMEAQVLGISGFDTFVIKTTAGDLEAECVILATGSQRKAPRIRGLKELEGRGVSYCAVCDAFFYRGKEVAVLGNGDFALHEAEELAAMASKVTICTNGAAPEFTGAVDFPVNTGKISKIQGEDQVTGICFSPEVSVQDTEQDQARVLPVAGVFVASGTAGSASIARQMGAALTSKGNIKINENMESTIPGLFAAGDCTGGLLQVAKAVYEGAQAGLSAVQYVRARAK